MTWQVWLAFVAVAAALIATPGPTVLVVLGCAVSAGPRRALASLLGVAAGDAVAITVSAVGFGAVLAASATAFTVLKAAGAAYLIYLGWQMWRAPPETLEGNPAQRRGTARGAIGHAFSVTVLNPKGILFFGAFLPQFIATGAPAPPQLLLLGATFIGLATGILGAYVLLLGRVRGLLASGGAMRVLQRTGGSLLIGAGVLTAALRRTA